MKRLLFVFFALILGALAIAVDSTEIIPSTAATMKVLHPNKPQSTKIESLTKRYSISLDKLKSEKAPDYVTRRDALNERFTKDFFSVLSPSQKSSYRKMIRSLREGFMKSHPEVDGDNIFIWGGANVL